MEPGKIMEFGTLETITGTLVSGLGISLLSRKSVEKLEREGLVQLFAVPYDFRFIKFVYIRRSDAYMGSAERKFIDELQEFVSLGEYQVSCPHPSEYQVSCPHPSEYQVSCPHPSEKQ
nr:LysR substrate-binding domain-containing protein [Paenibacillus sp. XY044]